MEITNYDSLGRAIAQFLADHDAVEKVSTYGVLADRVFVEIKSGEKYIIDIDRDE